MGKITIVDTHTVKPSGSAIATQEGGFYLSAWDQIFYGVYTKTVYFYKAPVGDMVEALRTSLGRALTHFYPMAGRFRWAGGRLEIDCNAEGVPLVEAECDEDLGYFQADMAHHKLLQLVPPVDLDFNLLEEIPFMFVQLTRLSCGGASLGLAISHCLVDGLSISHFLADWARLAHGDPLKEAPYLDRRVLLLRAREGEQRRQLNLTKNSSSFNTPPLLLGKKSHDDDLEERSKETVKLTFPLTEAQVHALKAIANLGAPHDTVSRPFSRYVVITAHMWRCACKARGHEHEQPTSVYIPLDVRAHIHSSVPIPPKYFGNTILFVNAASTSGELVSNPLPFACSKIREAISEVDEDLIWASFESEEEKYSDKSASKPARVVAPYHGNPNLRVTSWLTLPLLYDLDFGSGNCVGMRPVAREQDGVCYMMPNPDNNDDDGSILVVLGLQVAHAENFKKYFYEDILDV